MAAVATGAGGLLEREKELAVLADALADVKRDGRGRLVIVCGEAGVGKTALISRHCREQGSRARRILWGACEPLFTPSPLAPLADIAEDCGGEVARLLAAGGATPHALTVALVRELQHEAPTMLVLEDVHWADGATLDVIRLLGRRHTEVPALLLVSYRDTELDRFHPLRRVLGELGASGSTERTSLRPLSIDAVRSLAAMHGRDGEELYRKTAGNPFFVSEAIASGDELPATVRDAVLARAAGLAATATSLLEAVSVSPVPVELPVLETVVPGAVAGVEDCLAAGMLVAGASSLAFGHELARLAVEESIPLDRRIALHRRYLRALADGGGAARVAHHAEAAGDADAVLRYAPAAATDAASVGAHRDAAAQLGRALRFADGLPPEQQAELYERRLLECYLTTQDEEARAAGERAVAIYRGIGDRRLEGHALSSLSLVHLNMGDAPKADPIAAQAVELLETLPPGRELARAFAARSAIALLAEDTARTTAWATRAIELAERIGDVDARLSALGSAGAAEALRGSQSGRRTLEQALALASRHGLENHLGRVYIFLSMAGCRERSLASMEQSARAGLALSDERDLPIWGRLQLATRSWLELERCEWDAAAETTSIVFSQRCSLSTLQAQIVVGLLRARRGDPDPWTPLAEADRAARKTGHLWWLWQVAAARAEAAWLEGRPAQVAEATEETFRLALRLRSPWPAGELAVWRRRAGIEEESPADVVAPFALELAGDWPAAAARWRESGCVYEAALALAQADREEPLQRAHAELQRLDARPAAALVARRLRERGARRVTRGPRAATRANPANLTRRELDVLLLLADGLRNRDIAASLHLSHRTVDHHVAAILRKLGVRTRVEAVREGARLGLLERSG